MNTIKTNMFAERMGLMGKTRRSNREGNLIYNKSGTVSLRIYVTDPFTGKQKKIQVTGRNKTECSQKLKRRLQELELMSEKISVSSNITVTELCTNYINYKHIQELIKRTTYDRDECTIRNQIAPSMLGNLPIQTVTSKDIDDFFTKMICNNSLSESSIKKVELILNSSLNWAKKRGEILINPVDEIKKALDKRLSVLKDKNADDEDVRILSSEEEQAILEKSIEKRKNGNYKYPGGIHIRFLLSTGLRIGEYICLRWRDYDKTNHILRIDKCVHPVKTNNKEEAETNYFSLEGSTKNNKARNIVLLDEAIVVLDEIYSISSWRNPDDYIVLTRNNKAYTATQMEHIAGTVYRNSGASKNVSGLHILRRSFATRLFREGYSIKEVAAYLGDEEATVSKYYIAARETKEVNGKRIAIVSLRKPNKKSDV